MKKPSELISASGTERAIPRTTPKTDDRIARTRFRLIKFGCGHYGFSFHALRAYGSIVYLDANHVVKEALCFRCEAKRLLQTSIRCALCGRGIFMGKPVAAYRAGEGFRKDATIVKIGEAPCVLGCGRSDCAPGGNFIAGVWDGQRLVSAEETQAGFVEQMLGLFDGHGSACENCPLREVCSPDDKEACGGEGDKN